MILSNGEKLILFMLTEIYKKMGIKDGVDPDFIQEAIHSGNTWGIEWKYPDIFITNEFNPSVREEVINILDMWSRIETSYAHLSSEDKELIKANVNPFGDNIKFRGFDGNNESDYINIASFLINHLNRFVLFKGRDLNSHMPSLGMYRRMYSVYNSLEVAAGNDLSAVQIIEIFKGIIHPDYQ